MDDYTAPQWERSALLTIDVQRDFTLREAVFTIPGTAEAVPAMSTLAQAYREAGLPIVHIVRLYLTDGSNVDLCRRAMVESGARIAAPGSSGSQITADLLPSPDVVLDPKQLLRSEAQQIGPQEWIVYKGRFGAFYKTPLENLLVRLGVTTLTFVGCNFPNCPRTSIYEATERDFRVVAVTDAISAIYDRGMQELENVGVRLLTSEEAVRHVKKAENRR
jgi:nicotinamidase-related amidase